LRGVRGGGDRQKVRPLGGGKEDKHKGGKQILDGETVRGGWGPCNRGVDKSRKGRKPRE